MERIMRTIKDDGLEKIVFDFYLDKDETEELHETGFLEDYKYGIVITYNIDEEYRVYSLSHNWNGIKLNCEVAHVK